MALATFAAAREREAIPDRLGASNIRVFGSVAMRTAGDDSDVDPVVDT